MATIKLDNDPTPNGGVRSECIFKDKDGRTVDEEVAVAAIVLEYDKDDNVIYTTYLTKNPALAVTLPNTTDA